MILDREGLLRADLYSWMLARYCLPSKQPYSFDGYEYLIDLAKRKWPIGQQMFIRKSAQSGLSEWSLACLLWMNDRNLPNWKGSGLIFPATQQLQDHLKARLHPIMEVDYFNRKLKNLNLRYIRWNDKSIYFRGAQTRRDLISWSGDFVVLDEFDEFEDPIEIIPTIEQRQNASEYKWILGLSTPTIPDVGIDRAWGISSQHNWYIRCEKCQTPFSPVNEVLISGFENVVVESPISKEVGFVCPHCKDLTQTNGRPGEWLCDQKMDNARIAFSVSQLFIKNTNLKVLYSKYFESLNAQEFYNSNLGLPYAPASARLTRKQIEEQCVGVTEMPFASSEPTWMGVDVGIKCRWVVGVPKEAGHKEVLAYGVCNFDELEDIERRYNVRFAVIDLRPYEQEVKRHIGGRRGFYACDFNSGNQESWYTFTMADDQVRGHNIRIVKADRTQCCDVVIRELGNMKRVTLPRFAKDDHRFVAEMVAPIRTNDENPKTGDIKAVYNSGGKADHFFFAMAYLMLAFETKRSSIASLGPKIF